jgi:hypothetical protein
MGILDAIAIGLVFGFIFMAITEATGGSGTGLKPGDVDLRYADKETREKYLATFRRMN